MGPFTTDVNQFWSIFTPNPPTQLNTLKGPEAYWKCSRWQVLIFRGSYEKISHTEFVSKNSAKFYLFSLTREERF